MQFLRWNTYAVEHLLEYYISRIYVSNSDLKWGKHNSCNCVLSVSKKFNIYFPSFKQQIIFRSAK